MKVGNRFIAGFLTLALCSSGAFALTPQMPGERDRCPVCGMFVAPYPDWIATIVLADEKLIFFDGCKDMFRYYLKKWGRPGETFPAEVGAVYVTDYYTTRLVPVESVLFVVGSDVYGPMGKELIPIAGRKAAETFMRDHGGTALYRFDQIKPELLPVD